MVPLWVTDLGMLIFAWFLLGLAGMIPGVKYLGCISYLLAYFAFIIIFSVIANRIVLLFF